MTVQLDAFRVRAENQVMVRGRVSQTGKWSGMELVRSRQNRHHRKPTSALVGPLNKIPWKSCCTKCSQLGSFGLDNTQIPACPLATLASYCDRPSGQLGQHHGHYYSYTMVH